MGKMGSRLEISIITVVRNGLPYIEETLRSVLSQDYPDIEYIVIDGGSTDGTVELIRKYQQKIKYWVSEPDKGISDAFNKGLARAGGDYILFLNADDALANDRVISEIVHQVAENGDPDLIYGDCEVLDRASGESRYITDIDLNLSKFCKGRQMLPHPCLFAHRNYFSKYGNFDIRFRIGMDYEWLLRGIAEARVVHVPLVITRVRDGGVSALNIELAVKELFMALALHGYLQGWFRKSMFRIYYFGRQSMKKLLKVINLYDRFSILRHRLYGRKN